MTVLPATRVDSPRTDSTHGLTLRTDGKTRSAVKSLAFVLAQSCAIYQEPAAGGIRQSCRFLQRVCVANLQYAFFVFF